MVVSSPSESLPEFHCDMHHESANLDYLENTNRGFRFKAEAIPTDVIHLILSHFTELKYKRTFVLPKGPYSTANRI